VCSLSGHISPCKSCWLLNLECLAYFKHVVQLISTHDAFLVSIFWSTSNHIPLKYRCPCHIHIVPNSFSYGSQLQYRLSKLNTSLIWGQCIIPWGFGIRKLKVQNILLTCTLLLESRLDQNWKIRFPNWEENFFEWGLVRLGMIVMLYERHSIFFIPWIKP